MQQLTLDNEEKNNKIRELIIIKRAELEILKNEIIQANSKDKYPGYSYRRDFIIQNIQYGKEKIQLIEQNREYYGGGDGKAINRHSEREYKINDDNDKIIIIDRNLSEVQPDNFYYMMVEGNYETILQKYHLKGVESWSRAEEVISDIVNK